MKIRTQNTLRVLAMALLAGAVGTAVADERKAQDRDDRGITERESSQPVDDTWITTKVKADLLTTRDVSGLEINVETVDGVVTLRGDLATQDEVDRAVRVAEGIKGVKRVDASGLKVEPRTAGND